MWILYFQLIAAILTSSYAADLYCSSFTNNQCVFGNITNVTAPNETINVVGHPGFVDSMTQQLSINSTSQFSYFPTKILQIYTNVTSLTVSNNGLTSLVTNAVDYCQGLTILGIYNQLITHLPTGFAQNCVNLKYLDLYENQIASIDNDALKGLSKLTFLSVLNNKITCIPPGLFANTLLIQTIHLSINLITAIDPITFRGLPWLSQIYLGSNNIQYLSNLDLTGSAINSTVNPYISLNIDFSQVAITAIDPHFIPTLFGSRSNYTTFINFGSDNSSACVPHFVNVNKETYTQANVTLAKCYNNWKPSFVQPVACVSTTTTSTTTTTPKTTTANAASKNSSSVCAQSIASQGILNLILTKVMNMTLSISFP